MASPAARPLLAQRGARGDPRRRGGAALAARARPSGSSAPCRRPSSGRGSPPPSTSSRRASRLQDRSAVRTSQRGCGAGGASGAEGVEGRRGVGRELSAGSASRSRSRGTGCDPDVVATARASVDGVRSGRPRGRPHRRRARRRHRLGQVEPVQRDLRADVRRRRACAGRRRRRSPPACGGGRRGALLDWLGVDPERRIERESALDGESQAPLRGLVLLDLPDHDSIEPDTGRSSTGCCRRPTCSCGSSTRRSTPTTRCTPATCAGSWARGVDGR